MNNNLDDDEFLNKELNDLNKLIESARDIMDKMGGINPVALIQQHPGLNNTPINRLPPEQHSGLILYCVNKSNNPLPKFEKHGDSGFDLRANITQPIIIKPMTMCVVPTGLYFEISIGYEIQIRSRSGLAYRNQLIVLNQPGTIDSPFRGEVEVLLFNLGPNDIQINHGDRIAQGVVCPVFGSGKLTILETETLSQTDRGDGGFGHTGIN